jgi:hypothetical protein
MSSTRASPITRPSYWGGCSEPCTSSTRRRTLPRGCFECGDTTHFITDCPKRKKLDSSNKYDYTNPNDYNKGDNKKKNRFGDKKNTELKQEVAYLTTHLEKTKLSEKIIEDDLSRVE